MLKDLSPKLTIHSQREEHHVSRRLSLSHQETATGNRLMICRVMVSTQGPHRERGWEGRGGEGALGGGGGGVGWGLSPPPPPPHFFAKIKQKIV